MSALSLPHPNIGLSPHGPKSAISPNKAYIRFWPLPAVGLQSKLRSGSSDSSATVEITAPVIASGQTPTEM